MKPKDPLLFFKVYCCAVVVFLLHAFLGPQRAIKILRRRPMMRLISCSHAYRQRLVRYVEFAVSHWPFWRKKGRCLLRSLLIYSFLISEEEDLVMVVGVRKNQANWEGHAWLERDGKTYLDDGHAVEAYEKILICH